MKKKTRDSINKTLEILEDESSIGKLFKLTNNFLNYELHVIFYEKSKIDLRNPTTVYNFYCFSSKRKVSFITEEIMRNKISIKHL